MLLLCGQFAYAVQTLTIYTEQFPPYNFSNKGQLQGINLDITRTLCERVKVECQFELLPWARAYQLAQNNSAAGLVSTARTVQRETLFQWVGPLVSSRTFFYRLATNKHINPTDLNQVSAYSLGLVRGNVYEQLVYEVGFEADKNLLQFSHHYEYMNLFFKNKIDLILGSEYVLDYQLQQFGHGGKEVVKLVELPVEKLGGNYLAFNKAVPKEIIAQFNVQLQRLREEGEIDSFKNLYIHN
ncbi:transporter substrate-binding domain-containing protein [Pseudoalteromonas shioyasakiensis]|uniref:substrate-binding periplasmic protein n=1 Tax=Pseudoalteromonas shioyasakiensis TaxID=1190813 RepID=UPI0021187538|nr:transporter substrate-binding domain-containing protein [Pseudoalteromonas shioyasakiensis]MCQ8878866.1 transporter substrate-binding domain-containing protein [Pseudoalteromonas shioyasakiensis]